MTDQQQTGQARAELRKKALAGLSYTNSREEREAQEEGVTVALALAAKETVARLQAALGTAREMRPPTGMWQVSVAVPASLPGEMRDALFDVIADAAHAWEPADRDGWDVDVSGHPTPWPCPDARVHEAVPVDGHHTPGHVTQHEDHGHREPCVCGTMQGRCPCGEPRCYRCDPVDTSDCDRPARPQGGRETVRTPYTPSPIPPPGHTGGRLPWGI